MKYDLALRLKNAGFPQREMGGMWNFAFKYFKVEQVYFPTLSELIEACGEKFFRVSHSKNTDGTTWDAESWVSGDIETGNSPEEAVAELWLALEEEKYRHDAAMNDKHIIDMGGEPVT